ncbi:MAG TPA: hypothetical protein VEA16_08805 [Vicinamibacterales bacterium]|nr:hypothetical protein [Vicinamibacterales bacterium]
MSGWSVVSLAACAITGLALYVTRGVLDQAVTGDAIVRFAMLPPWQALLGFVCLAALAFVAIDHLNAPRGTTTFKRPRLGELVLPLCALSVLIVPFLPVIPDRIPALQALAGPLGAIVWLSVAGLQVWTLWQTRLLTARVIERWSVTRIGIALFAAAAIVAGAAASRLTGTALFPSGDEPHYLVMAQSLWRDGDLQIENNHQRGDYREYYPEDLEPHYLTRGADGAIYSIHPIGLALLLAPIYALAGYTGVVWTLIAMGALASALAWRWTVTTLNAAGAATFGWAAIALSTPFMFNTFTVYPEIAAALAVLFTFTATASAKPGASSFRWVAIGLAIAVLPWLSTKYAPMSAALLLVVVLRLRAVTGRGAGRPPELAAFLRSRQVWTVVAIYAISLVSWFGFFYAIWGSPLPMAPYGALVQTSPLNLRFGAPGLLFDQEYGLLAYAPVYVLAATGLYQMWRSGAELRRVAIEIAFVFAALLAMVGAFGIWWGGTSAPARPIASGLPLLMLPIAMAFRSAPAASPRRAAQHLLLWISIGIAVTLAVSENGLLINNNRDGTSALLGFWLPRWELWSLAPTFVAPAWTAIAWLHMLWWVAIAAAAAMLLARMRAARAGASALLALATLSAALLLIAITMPWLPAGPPIPRVDLGARSRLSALDGFDARARPASFIYDPMRKGAAVDVMPQLVLGVKPAQRSDPQPVRVLHNGRFSLPAGTYTIAVDFNEHRLDRPHPLSLQIGRNGPPLQTWSIQPQPKQQWSTTLWLPVDANFVGLRGPAELERAVARITITPTSVIDTGDRPLVATVLAAARYSAANVFFHEEDMYPEPQGFWTMGARSSRLTLAVPPSQTTVTLRVHSGATPNIATFSTFGWQQTLELTPGNIAEVQLPVFPNGVIPLTIDLESGFYPKNVDPKSADPRFLGLWIELKAPGGSAAANQP